MPVSSTQQDATDTYRIDADRLWDSLEQLSKIGSTEKGGVRRLAFTEDDRSARARFIGWCEAEGMIVHTDSIGNLFARSDGADAALPSIMIGSHLDSQPNGGKYDGTYGVLAGLEVVRQLNEKGHRLSCDLELVCWANEEGARFKPAMMGSSVFACEMALDVALATTDEQDISIRSELDNDSQWQSLPRRPDRRIGRYLEIHIEQGPILEDRGYPVGIVNGVQAIGWFDVKVVGEETHAGPPPMACRKDALMAAAEIALAAERIAQSKGEDGRGTVGQFTIHPGSTNVVPGLAQLSVDLRHPSDAIIDAMAVEFREAVAEIAARRGVGIKVEQIWRSPAVPFDQEVCDAFRTAANQAGVQALEMVSGAGHDAVPIGRRIPTGMLFIPCENGVSHNEAEAITIDQAAIGCSLLYLAVLNLAA